MIVPTVPACFAARPAPASSSWLLGLILLSGCVTAEPPSRGEGGDDLPDVVAPDVEGDPQGRDEVQADADDPGEEGTRDTLPPEDTRPPSDTTPDGDPSPRPDQPTLDELRDLPDDFSLEVGALCVRAAQCESANCARFVAGIEEGVCTSRCSSDDNCPDGWQCALIRTESLDVEFVCVDPGFCLDRDGDGFGAGPGCAGFDCDDTDPTIYFGAPEVCNGRDNNCDGVVDNAPVDAGASCDTGLLGICSAGVTACRGGVLECQQARFPQIEVCNGEDSNCDGTVDSGNPGGGLPCSTDGLGQCAVGETRCVNGAVVCAARFTPAPEVCDGLDNSCNGFIDDGYEGLGQVCFSGVGVCQRAGVGICDPSDSLADPICSAVPGQPFAEERCNYLDDLCDGEVDTGFRDENGIYFQDAHCGGCGIDCRAIFNRPNASGRCRVVDGLARCELVCNAGAFDLNGVPDDGCEFVLDTGAIYVSSNDPAARDDDACGLGPQATGGGRFPCRSIARGIARAQALSRARVLIADGAYEESVDVVDGISLLGGHRQDTWERNIAATLTNIRGASTGQHRWTLRATQITSPTLIEGLVLLGETNPNLGGNVYTVLIRNSNANLTLRNNFIYGGVGGAGAQGASGGTGETGRSGQGRTGNAAAYDAFEATGSGACASSNDRQLENGGSLSCGGVDVSGGRGGGNRCRPVFQTRTSGFNGAAGRGGGVNGGAGGGGTAGMDSRISSTSIGTICNLPPEPQTGAPGGAGTQGSAGGGGSGCSAQGALGSIVGNHWSGGSGASGGDGRHGGGGGGGGAGGGGLCNSGCTRDKLGGHGGGGGSGGCGGGAATGGGPGGGSIGVFITGGAPPTLRNNRVFLGAGGRGGDGGTGGVGGQGGQGGLGGICPGNCFCFNDAGAGGAGGNGGHGGGGGGGCGGSAFGIVTSGLGAALPYCAAEQGNSFLGGAAGQRGTGGTSLGAGGNNGSPGSIESCQFF